jgi:hypothetical protein
MDVASSNPVTGNSYYIDMGTLPASPTFAQLDSAYPSNPTSISNNNNVTISGSSLGLTSPSAATLPVVRTIVVQRALSGVHSYETFAITFYLTPVTAQTYTLLNANSQICFDIAGLTYADGALAQIYTCNGGANQSFQFTPSSSVSGAFNLVVSNCGKCLDVPMHSTATGVQLQQWDCNEGTNQAFFATPTTGPYYQLVNANSSLCLDASGGGTAPGTAVVQNTCNGASSQNWQLL